MLKTIADFFRKAGAWLADLLDPPAEMPPPEDPDAGGGVIPKR